MAYTVELAGSVDRELSKLDAQHGRRILRFLRTRVARLDDPRSIGEALHGSLLGENTASAIIVSSAKSKTTAC